MVKHNRAPISLRSVEILWVAPSERPSDRFDTQKVVPSVTEAYWYSSSAVLNYSRHLPRRVLWHIQSERSQGLGDTAAQTAAGASIWTMPTTDSRRAEAAAKVKIPPTRSAS